jgi:hypothetical protein
MSPVPWNIVEQGYFHFVKSMVAPVDDLEGEAEEPRPLNKIVDDAETYESRIAATKEYTDRLSVTVQEGEEGHVFVNGRYFKKNDVSTSASFHVERSLRSCRNFSETCSKSWGNNCNTYRSRSETAVVMITQ